MLSDQLKEAGRRCDMYLVQYGVEAVWEVHIHGMVLKASNYADKVERTISWGEVEALMIDPFKQIEEAALAGLSS